MLIVSMLNSHESDSQRVEASYEESNGHFCEVCILPDSMTTLLSHLVHNSCVYGTYALICHASALQLISVCLSDVCSNRLLSVQQALLIRTHLNAAISWIVGRFTGIRSQCVIPPPSVPSSLRVGRYCSNGGAHSYLTLKGFLLRSTHLTSQSQPRLQASGCPTPP